MSTGACLSPRKACRQAGQEVRGIAARIISFSALSLILILALGVGTAAGQEPPNEGPGPDPTRKLIAKRSLTLNTRGPDGNPVGKQVYIHLYDGQDHAAAAANFCFDFNLDPGQVTQIAGYVKESLAEQAPDYVASDVEELRTAGAYSKRAGEHSKEDRHMEAAADLTRALLRPGIDPQAKEKIEKKLVSTFEDQRAFLAAEAKAAAEKAALEARQRAEDDAIEEAKRRKEADEADWAAFTKSLESPELGRVVFQAEVTLTKGGANGAPPEQVPVPVILHEGRDHHDVAADFCSKHGLHRHEEVVKIGNMVTKYLRDNNMGYTPPAQTAQGWQALRDKAAKEAELGQFIESGADYARAVVAAGAPPQDVASMEGSAATMLRVAKLFEEARVAFAVNEWDTALSKLHAIQKEIPISKNQKVLLMQARCNQQLGKWTEVVRVTGTLLQHVTSRGSWQRGQPRMIAASLGAAAAMEMGDSDKALKFYQLVLRNDPDQKDTDAQYKGLKKIVKMLKEADELLSKSKNHKAMAVLDDALSVMKGLDVSSGMFRTNILLRMCTANSELRRHEEALMACDQCVKQRENPAGGVFVSPRKVSEAYSSRATAHMNDHNYDDAVRDYRAARDYMQQGGRPEELQSLDQKLNEASFKKREWEERRDHRMVLELPVNLHQIAQDKQCNWVKKQHKLLARKWHPDKAKGDKARAARKMREVSEAKEALTEQLRC